MRTSVRVLWLGVAFLLLCGSVCAEDAIQKQGNPGFPSAPKRSVSEFLTPDGRFDLQAARKSGYQGPLDIAHFAPNFDPVTGEPVFRPSVPASQADHPDDIYWDNSISPSVAGIGDIGYAMTVYSGKLIVGGYFTVAGDVTANSIAAWDGSSWSPLGSGMYGGVRALTVYDDKLIAGGDFTAAGGVAANYIAAWDGSSWSSLGLGLSGPVHALTVYKGRLIAGGPFGIAGLEGGNWIPSVVFQ